MKNKNIDLLEGNITDVMIRLSLPLMGTAFIQMAYTLVDLMWLGKLSTNAVAAVGCIGFFVWIVMALTLISKTGISVGMSQAYGKGDHKSLVSVLRSGFQVNTAIFIIITILYIVFKKELVGFYKLDKDVEKLALDYFNIVITGLVFIFLTAAFSAVFYAGGDSKTPFKISTISLIINIILDPILIFGWWIFPRLGIKGAAIATVFAQGVQVAVYLYLGIKYKEIYIQVNYFENFDGKFAVDILKLGVPTCLTSIVHALVSMKLNSYIAGFGAASIAAFTIGSQIESISWMSAEGFSTAFSTFFGQNYGANRFERLKEARRKGMIILSCIGAFASVVLFVYGENIFRLFIPVDEEVIKIGGEYLKINAISELFMAYEIGTTGMLNGLGLTRYPSINSVILNVLRIPLAIILMPGLMVNGLWAAISISSCLKGLVILFVYFLLNRKTDGFRINMDKYVSRVKNLV
ncbi:MATE family efflux transporter [Peptoniphilus catoniae]|uniref:MATE family efflux transporter n=1 Tax=Peptoniphilus catoniae TaxID=1660341 RepID=UPI0010FD404E|nr:MATE family efflux transporter [Peptoniphilus catoniae]